MTLEQEINKNKAMADIMRTQGMIWDNKTVGDMPLRASEKPFLTLEEASEYFNLGVNKIRILTTEHPEFVIYNGNRRLIKRQRLLDYMEQSFYI